jgi:hypothetical protein
MGNFHGLALCSAKVKNGNQLAGLQRAFSQIVKYSVNVR